MPKNMISSCFFFPMHNISVNTRFTLFQSIFLLRFTISFTVEQPPFKIPFLTSKSIWFHFEFVHSQSFIHTRLLLTIDQTGLAHFSQSEWSAVVCKSNIYCFSDGRFFRIQAQMQLNRHSNNSQIAFSSFETKHFVGQPLLNVVPTFGHSSTFCHAFGSTFVFDLSGASLSCVRLFKYLEWRLQIDTSCSLFMLPMRIRRGARFASNSIRGSSTSVRPNPRTRSLLRTGKERNVGQRVAILFRVIHSSFDCLPQLKNSRKVFNV